jgi:hypothetical protein
MAARSSALLGLLRRRIGWSWTTIYCSNSGSKYFPFTITTTTPTSRSFQASAALLGQYHHNSKNKSKNKKHKSNHNSNYDSYRDKGPTSNNHHRKDNQQNKNKQQMHQKQRNNHNNQNRNQNRKPSIWDQSEEDDNDENDIFKVFVPHNYGGRINWKQVPVSASDFQKGPMDSDFDSDSDDSDDDSDNDEETWKFQPWDSSDDETYGDGGIHLRDPGFMVFGPSSRKKSKQQQIHVQSSSGNGKWDGTTAPARLGQVPTSRHSDHPLSHFFDSDDDEDDELDMANFFGNDMAMGGPDLEEILKKAHACVTAQMSSQLGEDLEVGPPFSQCSSTVLAGGKGNYKTRLELEFPIYSRGRKDRYTGRVVATGTNLELLQVTAHGRTVSLNTTITRKREIFENDQDIVEAEIIEEKTESKVM